MQAQSEENDNFRSSLQQLLEDRGWSQSALARVSGLSQAVISKYLLKKSEPGARELAKIAEAFGVTMDALWYGIDDHDLDGGAGVACPAEAELAELKHSLRVVFRAMSEPEPAASISKQVYACR